MKPVVDARYRRPDALEPKDVKMPAPKDNEVTIGVHAASVNAADWHLVTADIFLIRLMGGGLLKPQNTLLGADLAGGEPA